jgi:hypothetical protein
MDRKKGLDIRIEAFGQHGNRLRIQNFRRQYRGCGVKVSAFVGRYDLHAAILYAQVISGFN